MVVCDDFDFSKEMIGYDLRRNESVSHDYKRRFAPNMYTKVSINFESQKDNLGNSRKPEKY